VLLKSAVLTFTAGLKHLTTTVKQYRQLYFCYGSECWIPA